MHFSWFQHYLYDFCVIGGTLYCLGSPGSAQAAPQSAQAVLGSKTKHIWQYAFRARHDLARTRNIERKVPSFTVLSQTEPVPNQSQTRPKPVCCLGGPAASRRDQKCAKEDRAALRS